MKILGIDPGLLNLGCVLLEVEKGEIATIYAETLKTSPQDPLSKRLFYLYKELERLLRERKPEVIVLEEAIPKANPQSTAKVMQTKTLVFLLSEEMGIPLRLYHPSFWKSFLLGNGMAKKGEIKKFLKGLLGDKIGLIKNEHLADALALTLVYALEENLIKEFPCSTK